LISDAIAKTELHTLVRELEGFQGRLLALRQRLPFSPQVAPGEDLNSDPDVPTEITWVIDCVLLDSIGPAIRDLSAAAEYEPGVKAEGEP
jgi:hypothetical protein